MVILTWAMHQSSNSNLYRQKPDNIRVQAFSNDPYPTVHPQVYFIFYKSAKIHPRTLFINFISKNIVSIFTKDETSHLALHFGT